MKSKLLLLVISLATVVPNAYCKDVVLASQVTPPPAVPDRSQGVQSLFSPRNIAMAAGAACCVGGLLFYRHRRRGRTEPPVPVGAQSQAQEKTGIWNGFFRWIASFFSSSANDQVRDPQQANGMAEAIVAFDALSPDKQADTKALCSAIESGDIREVKKLLSCGVSLHTRNEFGYSPLHLAAWASHVETVRLLLDAGARIEESLGNNNMGVGFGGEVRAGKTPLMLAALHRKPEVMQVLLDRGANIEATDGLSNTVLMLTAAIGNIEGVTLLLDNGADVNASDRDGKTVLIFAARHGHEAVVKLLLDRGADVVEACRQGQTALIWATRYGHGHEAVVKLLLDRGAILPTAEERDQAGLTGTARQLIDKNKKYAVACLKDTKNTLLSDDRMPTDLVNVILYHLNNEECVRESLMREVEQ